MSKNKNYEEVKSLIDDLINRFSDGNYVFRGMNRSHSDEYDGEYKEKEINSSLFRKHYKDKIWNEYFSPIQAEKEIVEKAKKYFPSNTSNIEILTDLRHYHGKVNLIDFTRDFHIALFFACNGKFEEDGQLIFLKTDGLNIINDIEYKTNKISEYAISIIEPKQTRTSKNRVIAQKSVFVYSSKGYISKNSERCFTREVKHNHKKNILEYLRKFHDISSDTIYNDLIGFIDNERIYSSADVEFFSKALP